MHLSDTRFGSALGASVEGDHAVSHRVALAVVAETIEGAPITEIPGKLYNTFSSIFPDCNWPQQIELERERVDKSSPEGELMQSNGLDVEVYNLGLRAKRAEQLEKYAYDFMHAYCKMKELTHERTGKKGDSEGPGISGAVASLNAINKFLKVDKEIINHEANGEIEKANEKKIEFTKQALGANGVFVDGMLKIFYLNEPNKKINDIREMFGLPKDVAQEHTGFFRKGLTTGDNRRYSNEDRVYENFFNQMRDRSHNPKLIGALMEKTFDFPYDQRPKADQDKWKKNNVKEYVMTKDKLVKASSECLSMMFAAYPEIKEVSKELDRRNDNNISYYLLENTIENQGWKEDVIINLKKTDKDRTPKTKRIPAPFTEGIPINDAVIEINEAVTTHEQVKLEKSMSSKINKPSNNMSGGFSHVSSYLNKSQDEERSR